jgi:glucans biosynthesis protein
MRTTNLLWAAAAVLALAAGAPAPASAFDLDGLAVRAAALAREPYRDRRGKVPPWMLISGEMTYDHWRDIRFRPDRSLWRDQGLPFQVQFFHPGLYYERTVAMHVIDGDRVAAVPFDVTLFDYGKNTFAARIPTDIGYAGFRIHAPFKTSEYYDEVIVFLGATYFRAVGRDNAYGLSARGVAVDTVEPTGEEFPHFEEFWLVTPAPGARSLMLYALMDGPSLAGAYRFEVTPGVETTVTVESRLFPRRRPAKLGLAPLTSMFFFGENSTKRFPDFRPEVHDSDGLLLHFDGGEWLWRPLDNPPRIHASGFRMRNPRGFGLVQRDRDFGSYQDLETRTEARPSAWVVPRGDWGKGRVELVEIPTTSELVDNVVAFWVPDTLPKSGGSLPVGYTVHFYGDDPMRPPAGRVLATRRDRGTLKDGSSHRFVIDFGGGRLEALPAERSPAALVSVGPSPGAAQILDQHVVRNPAIGGWRLSFQIRPSGSGPVELRAFLRDGDDVLSETWSNVVLP